MSNPSLTPCSRLRRASCLAVFALVAACNDDDATDVSKFGPERALLVGTWARAEGNAPGTITFRDDGTFARLSEPGGAASEGAWALKGSRLSWDDGRQETIAITDATLYFDVFVRKPGKESDLSGTWASYRGDAYGFSHEVWEISGTKFDFDLHSVRDGFESNAAGHGYLEVDGERYTAYFEDGSSGAQGSTGQEGRLVLQQLGPNALHITFARTTSTAENPEPSLEAWTKAPQ
jgi:hypothetical protein